MAKKLVRFDWAIKKILRHKANFDILEGFLSELLKEDIKIKQILESESNKETADDKFNRVDILVEDTKGELIIIEIQDSKEYDYFHRMLFGAAKAITEHIREGQPYADVKKVIAITIAYFDLGQGEDYVYHGTSVFKGIHKNDILTLADKQIELYQKTHVYEIFPEYWVIKIGKFTNTVKDKLDEWIYFLKNAEVKKGFSAKGLKEANERLDEMKLSEQEAISYKYYLKRLRNIASEQHTKMADAQDLLKAEKLGEERGLKKGEKLGLKKGEKIGQEKGEKIGQEKGEKIGQEKGEKIGQLTERTRLVIAAYERGNSPETISLFLGISLADVQEIIEIYKKNL